MKVIKSITLILVITLLAGTMIYAADKEDLKRVVSVRRAPVQTGPSGYSSLKGFAKLGTPVEILKEDGLWCEVKYVKRVTPDMEQEFEVGYIHKSALVTIEQYERQKMFQDENEKGLAAGAKGFSEDEQLSAAAKGFSEDEELSAASKGFSEDEQLSAASKGFSEDEQLSAASKGFSEDEQLSAASKGFSEDEQLSAASKGFSEDEQLSAASKGFNSEIEKNLKNKNKDYGYQVVDNIIASGNHWDVVNPQKRMADWRQEGRVGEFSPYYTGEINY